MGKQDTSYLNSGAAIMLVAWLESRGYQRREVGPRDEVTGRGRDSHPAEYQRGHVRVRINAGGVIVLRDPGCTLQVLLGPREQASPNMARLDTHDYLVIRPTVLSFEASPAVEADL